MRSFRLLGILLPLFAATAVAQPVTDAARLQGYVHRQDTTTFVFDVDAYGVTPERVVVTGAFRGWSDDMTDAAWQLRPHAEAGVWTLAVPNAGYEAIGASTPFKYRVDDGRWLDPRTDAPNQEGGNLIFLYGIMPPGLRAEIAGPRTVWAWVTGDDVRRPLDPAAYRLVDAAGTATPVASVLPRTADQTLLVPAEDLDPRRVYYVEVPAHGLRARARFDGWFRTAYSDKPLGAEVASDGGETTFRVFAPRADRVALYLYDGPEATPAQARAVVPMTRDADGVWEATRAGDLHGTYYDYRVYGGPIAGEPGTYFFETHGTHASDPYARVNVDAWGKSRVWRPTTPATPVRGGRPKMEDVVAYEVHVQDFTDTLPVPDRLKGTLPAMTMPGLRNERGEPVGFDYLVDLGINVVHLMPVQEFLHYPDSLWRATFADDPYMIAQGVAEENYQWGYRTTHAFAVETRFREKGTEHGAQRAQFRDLVQAFHDAGIAVIIDIVPNHTGENMDGRHDLLNFNVLDLPYYYRTDEDVRHIGPFGNEVKTEDRPMTQRWLIDQARHFVDEFGVDGFRVDLAGQIDQQTLAALMAALPDDVIVYGEPWIAPSDPDVRANPDWAWYKADAPITYFQDDARNAFKGPTSNPQDKAVDRGYAGGDAAQRERVMLALTNGFAEERDPNRGINYLDIHDNWALADRFATADWNGLRGVDEGPFKVAAGLLFTSLGPVVVHGGTEIMRSKGHAPLEEIVKHYDGGEIHIHGKRDTYNLRRANHYLWDTVGATKADGPLDVAGMLAYWKGLIALRMSDAGAVFRVGTEVPEGYYRWILPDNRKQLGYVVDDRVLVLVNTDAAAQRFDGVTLPAGRWTLVANADAADPAGVEGADAMLLGGTTHVLTVPPTSLKVWVRE